MSKKYTFLQISDLHFGNTESIYDRDADLRNELKLDVQRVIAKHRLSIDGILICGDIAFSGKAEEYQEAERFLEMLRELLAIDIERVFCVPGNHDVDQSIPKNNIIVYALQKLLQNASTEEQLKYLQKLNQEKKESATDYLFQPLEQYNRFAQKHNGGVGISNPYTDCPLELEDGYQLMIHGMNSTLISNAEDHNWKNHSEKEMVVERTQIPQARNKCIYMTLCHHPVDCWSDKDNQLNMLLNNRVMIQLFGHTHKQSIQHTQQYIRIISGALQPPDRFSDDWNAQYNFITVEYDTGKLLITIYPRILDDTKSSFQASRSECDTGKECVTYVYVLEEGQAVSEETTTSQSDEKSGSIDSQNYSKKRKFIIDFYHLTPKQRRVFIQENCDGKFVMKEKCKDEELVAFVEMAESIGKLDQIVASIASIRMEG